MKIFDKFWNLWLQISTKRKNPWKQNLVNLLIFSQFIIVTKK